MFVFVHWDCHVLAVLLVQFSRGTSLFKPTYNLYPHGEKRGRAKAAGEKHPDGGCAGRNGCGHLNSIRQGTNSHNHFEGLHEIPKFRKGRAVFNQNNQDF